MTPAEVLLAARDLLLTKGWTQGAYARTIDGTSVAHVSRDAVSYCMIGAMGAVASFPLVDDAADLVYAEIPRMLGISGYNDTPGRTREEVCDLLLRCAEKATT